MERLNTFKYFILLISKSSLNDKSSIELMNKDHHQDNCNKIIFEYIIGLTVLFVNIIPCNAYLNEKNEVQCEFITQVNPLKTVSYVTYELHREKYTKQYYHVKPSVKHIRIFSK